MFFAILIAIAIADEYVAITLKRLKMPPILAYYWYTLLENRPQVLHEMFLLGYCFGNAAETRDIPGD